MHRPRLAHKLVLAASIIAAPIAGACSLALKFDECTQNDHCQGEDGVVRACVDNRCVGIEELACETHSTCGELFGDSFVCGQNADTEPRCVDTDTDLCEPIVWPEGSERDDTVIVASIMPLSEQFEGLILPLQNAVQLALLDFNAVATLPGGRKIAWVACNSAGGAEDAVDAAKFLADEVGVPAIIGPIFSESVLEVAERVTIDRGVFLISPTASSKEISSLSDQGLVWRTIASDIYQASAIVERIDELDPPVEKLVFLAKQDVYGQGLLNEVFDPLRDVLSGGALATYAYDNPAGKTTEALQASYAGVISQAYTSLKPDTVVLAGTSEVQQLIGLYLLAWADDFSEDRPPAPPRFIVSHGAVPVLEDTIRSLAAEPMLQMAMYGFLEGTAPIIHDEQNFAAFNTRYRLTFSEQDAITSSSLSYDAAMVTLFAMVAIPENQDITGARIAAAMPRLVDKGAQEVSFGDSVQLQFVTTARDILASGGSVDLKGVSGDLDFDTTTGEVRTNIIGWGLTPVGGDFGDPLLTAVREFVLEPTPGSTKGQWMPAGG